MKKMLLWVILIVIIPLMGCQLSGSQLPNTQVPSAPPTSTPWVPPADSTRVEVRLIIAKMVAQPQDRERDFTVIRLDGRYAVYFQENSCMTDDRGYMYGPYDSVRHCPILQPNISDSLVTDQAWLKDSLAPLKQYLNCINGWVYLGKDQSGKEEWFIEMFGFHAFC